VLRCAAMATAIVRDTLNVRLGDLRGRLAARSARDGVAEGAFVREALVRALDVAGEPPPVRPALPGLLAGERSRVRLPAYESARLNELARRAGLSPSGYVAKLIGQAGGGAGAAEPTRGAIEALIASNSRLAQIGVNLNQVARRLNSAPGQITLEERNTLDRVLVAMQEHLQEAAAVLALLRPGRRTVRDQLAAMARTLTELGRSAKSSPAAVGEDQRSLVESITGALARLKIALGCLPAAAGDRGTRGRGKRSRPRDNDDEQAD
jgi:hypothetical protein